MKLFDTFEAVRYPEEEMIFITRERYLYYIYDTKKGRWSKYRNAGNDSLTVENYPDVSREDLMAAMNGKFPEKEADFMRMCNPLQLCIRDMMDVLREDYAGFMSEEQIRKASHKLLQEMNDDICYKAYLRLRKIFDGAINRNEGSKCVLPEIKELSYNLLGRDIFKKEIRIVNGHNSSSCFWIMPVRFVGYEDDYDYECTAEMNSVEISIEEDDVDRYLTPFLYPYFDGELEANRQRKEGNRFEWYLTHNFYTMDSVERMLEDIQCTVKALAEGTENRNGSRPAEKNTERERIIDFYQRFIYRMEYMMKAGKENGYDLISFMGP